MHKRKSENYHRRKPGRAIGNLAMGKAHFKNRLNFITLSWGKRGEKFIWSPNSKAFPDVVTTPLSFLNGNMCDGIDFVICAGRAVTIPKRFQTSEQAKSALRCTQGASIIFEVLGTGGGRSWGLLRKDPKEIHFDIVRSHQIIAESGETDKKKARSSLKHVLDNNEGLLHFKNQNCRFQLFICGENNFIKKTAARSKKSLFVFDLNELALTMPIPKFCADEKWVLINPSHRPYTPVISGGGANYNTVGGVRPSVARMIKDRKYKDGTYPPLAIIHVNNYSGEWSAKQATRIFTRKGGLKCRKYVAEFRRQNKHDDRAVFISRRFQIKLPTMAIDTQVSSDLF
jgi:hypothetical protein